MNEDLTKALAGLETKLESKSAESIESKFDDFEKKYNQLIQDQGTEVKEQWDTLKKEAEAKVAELNAVSAKLKEIQSAPVTKGGIPFDQTMACFIKENTKSITEFSGKLKFGKQELKVVGNMSTSNITGDLYRSYSNEVVAVLPRLVHVVDLLGPDVQIGTGVYTFPRETGSEGSISTQTEGSAKSQIDYDFTHVDVATDFLAGFAVYSKKMRNNAPYLENFLPRALRRDYMNAEDTLFEGLLDAAATTSSEIITGQNKVEMLIADMAALEGINVASNYFAVTPADFYDILITEKSTGSGYGLPGVVTFENGMLRINGVQVVKGNWVTANEYYVGDFSEVNRVVTEGLSLEFSEHDSTNFRTNAITARIEAQIGLAIHRPVSIIQGDFTAT